MRRIGVGIASLGLVVVTLMAHPVAAASSCTWDPGSATLSIVADGRTMDRLVVVGSDILFNGTSCDPSATTATVDVVAVSGIPVGERPFVIDLGGGPFAPGAEVEGMGASEIEVSVDGVFGLVVAGAPDGDVISVGSGGVNLNADDDADLMMASVEFLSIEGRGGNDTIMGAGDPAVGDPPPKGLHAVGGAGDDTLLGGREGDFLFGGPGRDDLSGGAGGDYLAAGMNPDEVDGGAGRDLLTGGRGADVVRGGSGRDQLSGGRGSDVLAGGEHGDTLLGDRGTDAFLGGPGRDWVSFASAPRSLHVSLLHGTSTGWGTDRLVSIENVQGSRWDDALVGDERRNTLDGWLGSDLVRGKGDDDRVFGSLGPDILGGGRGADLLVGDSGDDAFFGGPGMDTCRQGLGTGPEFSCEK